MKVTFLLALVCLFTLTCALRTSPFASSDAKIEEIMALHSADVTTNYIKMKIDHFNANGESADFNMRYLTNYKHYKKGGPIFFYAGNEGNVWTFYNNTGFMVNTLAQEFGAAVVFAEHRYFGESMPFGKESFDKENLKFLNVEQVMTDYVEFIKAYKDEKHEDLTPVILFGGSYGGMLAAWLRMKFPETFQGAIASSAPILYFKGATPEDGFDKVVNYAFTRNHPQCSNNIRSVHKILQEMKCDESKIAALQGKFNFCQATTKPQDVDKVIAFIDNAWVYMAMTNYPYPTDFLNPMPGWPVDESCKPFNFTTEQDSTVKHLLKGSELFSDNDDKLLQATYQSISVYYNFTGQTACYDLDDEGTGNLDGYGWNVLACNELAMPMSSMQNSMFLPSQFDYDAYSQYCHEQFGITTQYDYALTYFGGRHITHDFMYATNIVFSNGDIDPWNAGSVTSSVGKGSVVMNIENSAHHLDLRDPNPADPSSVVKARETEKAEIKRWIEEYTHVK